MARISGAVIFIFLCSLVATAAFSAGNRGEEIFKSNGCIFCHKQEMTSGTIPSLFELANAYKSNHEQLIRYLKGEADPIIRPARSVVMKRQLRKTKALSDSERAALADFILSH
jgi:cytochrome c551/c552